MNTTPTTYLSYILFACILLCSQQVGTALAFEVSNPTEVRQGDPFVISVTGVEPSEVTGTFSGSNLNFFKYQNAVNAFVGVDLQAPEGVQELIIRTVDGRTYSSQVHITLRDKPVITFENPEDFGGNTVDGAKKTISALAADNQILSKSLWSNKRRLWTESFMLPLQNIYVTDVYGYSRSTSGNLITHKGTDFRAKEGTEVYAMNRGVVRFAKKLTVYGNTVVIDHGQGIMTMYMHLSTIVAKQGHIIRKGDLVGYSGMTGYSQGPHLHLSVRVSNKSIDPEVFMKLFATSN